MLLLSTGTYDFFFLNVLLTIICLKYCTQQCEELHIRRVFMADQVK